MTVVIFVFKENTKLKLTKSIQLNFKRQLFKHTGRLCRYLKIIILFNAIGIGFTITWKFFF